MRRFGILLALLVAAAPWVVTIGTQEGPGPAPSRLLTIVVDAGHGGDDTGVRGASGLEEKQLTLDVAGRLRVLLETRHALRVVMTRDADVAMAPDERAGAANGARGDLFVSLHANASPVASVSGAEIYYRTLEGLPAEPAPGPADAVTLIPWDEAPARHFDLSARTAGLIQEEIERQMPMTARAIRQAPLRGVAGVNMPAVVVEMLFLTNAAQEQAAAATEFKDQMALALAEAIARFRSLVIAGPVP